MFYGSPKNILLRPFANSTRAMEAVILGGIDHVDSLDGNISKSNGGHSNKTSLKPNTVMFMFFHKILDKDSLIFLTTTRKQM